ncbi:hypothetical protein [Salinibius halmophilus]|uniref:hypothetical protein n=1 Tax=Salinibius halmophilus TaxID=1853216 RepID=UPI000E67095B|nr:hypothetical protein [Salinibius halmophilus]
MKRIIALFVAAAASAAAASNEVEANPPEISAARSLELLAQEKRFSRQLSGDLTIAAGAGFPVLFGSSVVMAGLSAKNVIFKSSEEEALAGVAKPLSVQVMPTIDGGIAMQASFSF